MSFISLFKTTLNEIRSKNSDELTKIKFEIDNWKNIVDNEISSFIIETQKSVIKSTKKKKNYESFYFGVYLWSEDNNKLNDNKKEKYLYIFENLEKTLEQEFSSDQFEIVFYSAKHEGIYFDRMDFYPERKYHYIKNKFSISLKISWKF